MARLWDVMVLTDTLGDQSPGVGYPVCDLECDVGVGSGDRAGDVEFQLLKKLVVGF